MHGIVTPALLLVVFLHQVISDGSNNDDDIFTCKPSKNFERKVNLLIYEKTKVYDGLVREVNQLKQYRSLDGETIRRLESEVEEMRERLRILESTPGIKLNDCPKSGKSGVYTVHGLSYPKGLRVYCDTETDGGGWTVFQLRKNGMLDFDREWSDYVEGFGSITEEFWLGLKTVKRILSSGQFELRVDLQDWDGNTAYAVYSHFALSGEDDNFAITVSGYKGTAGDSLAHHSGAAFSTKDRDNDQDADGNCAKDLKGGWWFTNCNLSHLNGKYYEGGWYSPPDNNSPYDGASWYYWKNTKLYSMRVTAMKIRKK